MIRRRAERTNLAESAFTLEQDHSVLGHTTASEADYGTALCWAENAVGAQEAPCAFREEDALEKRVTVFVLWCPKRLLESCYQQQARSKGPSSSSSHNPITCRLLHKHKPSRIVLASPFCWDFFDTKMREGTFTANVPSCN